MIENLQPEDIDATLKYGQIFVSKGWRILFITMYSLLGIVLAIVLTMLIGIPLTVGEFDSSSIAAIVGCSSVAIMLSIIFTCLLLYFRSGKKKAEMWLQDAVLLKAKTKSLGEQVMVRGLMVRKAAAIEVVFTYNDMQYIRQSTYKEEPAYLPVFMNYINQTIMIAYSPRYDEVMLIKHESINKKHIGLK